MNRIVKRTACLLLCLCMAPGLFGCAAPTAPETRATEIPETAALTEPAAPSAEAPTEVPTEPAALFSLDETEITFARKGEEAALYSGPMDGSLIEWTSDDISVALFHEGTVIAVGSGETMVHADYRGRRASCRVVSNADPEEPRPLLTPEIWHAPQRRIPETEEDVGDYFADTIFMGDSTSYSLYQWHLKTKSLGEAMFLVRGGVSIHSLIDGRRKYFHQAVEKLAEDAVRDAVQEEGRKKLYIMLGANDLPQFGVEKTMELMDTFLSQLLAKSPELEIYLQSITPVRTREQYAPGFTNEDFDTYNDCLKDYAQEKGFHYVDIASYFKDNENGLVEAYSYDKLHANADGCNVWYQALKKSIAEEMRGETK